MRDRIIIILICCFMAVSLMSCSKGESKQPQTEANNSNIETKSTAEQTTFDRPEVPQDGTDQTSQQPEANQDTDVNSNVNESQDTNVKSGAEENQNTNTKTNIKSSKTDVKNTNIKNTNEKSGVKEADNFRELKPGEIPGEIADAIGFEAVRYYQKGDCIYLLTYTGPKNSEKTNTYRMYPSCNEIWTYNIKTKELAKLFVKYDYDFGNSRQGSNYNRVSGLILSIDDIDSEGNVYFTESWNEGMEHYGNRKFKYLRNENKIITLGFQAGRPEIYTSEEVRNICNEVFTSKILCWFYKIAEIVDKDNGKSSFNYFNDNYLYGVMYNLQNSDGDYYHEISRYDIQSGNRTPLVRKMLPGKDEDPFIYIQGEDKNGIIVIKDRCSFNTDIKANQTYLYDPVQKSIKLAESAVETGTYIVVGQ